MLISDRFILGIVSGNDTELESAPPARSFIFKPTQFSKAEEALIACEINKLISKGVLECTNHTKNEISFPNFPSSQKRWYPTHDSKSEKI